MSGSSNRLTRSSQFRFVEGVGMLTSFSQKGPNQMDIENPACEFNSLEKRSSGQFTPWKPKWVDKTRGFHI